MPGRRTQRGRRKDALLLDDRARRDRRRAGQIRRRARFELLTPCHVERRQAGRDDESRLVRVWRTGLLGKAGRQRQTTQNTPRDLEPVRDRADRAAAGERADGEVRVFPFQRSPRKGLNKAWAFVRASAGWKRACAFTEFPGTPLRRLASAAVCRFKLSANYSDIPSPARPKRYAHLADDPLKEAAAKIGAAIAGAGKQRRQGRASDARSGK